MAGLPDGVRNVVYGEGPVVVEAIAAHPDVDMVSFTGPGHALVVARRLRAGQVDVNGGDWNPLAPFGGYKQSGSGREFGRDGLGEFVETKAIRL